MEKNMKFKNFKQIQDYAAETNKVLVVYNDYVLDATTFAQHHPGGAGLILNYQTKDVTEQMKAHQPLTLRMADSLIVGTFQKQIRKYINPDQALMPQIWNMDHQTYLRIVDSPHWLFVPSPKMFAFQPFEPLSHNKWYHIYILPLLFIAYLFYITNWEGSNIAVLLLTFVLGIFSFSLTEYLLHRFIFHSEKHLFDNRLMRYLHYVMHGIHHMLPNDPDRLVYPPVLGVITVLIGYQTVYRIIYFENQALNSVFWAGFFIGYISYDTIHYMLHHWDTSKSKGSYFHRLQKYHNQHHFGGQQAGYGVSSKFWDIIFRTEFKKTFKHGQNLQKIE